MNQQKFFGLALMLSCLLTGCRFDYKENEAAEDLSEDIPETILIGVNQTAVRNGRESYSFTAKRAEAYDKKKQTILEKVQFSEFNSEGEIVTEGEAQRAILFNESEDAEVSGAMTFRSEPNDATIKASYLYWSNQEKKLTGKPDKIVRVLKDDGTEVQGRDFQADMRRLHFTFGADTQGVFVSTDDEEEETVDEQTASPLGKIEEKP